MGKMNAGNWGALLQGGVQGAETEQNMESKNLQNQYYKNALVDPAAAANQYDQQAFAKWQQAHGQESGIQPFQAPQGLFDPVKNNMHDIYSWAKAKLSSFLPGQGQHASGPASQSTVPAPGNAAMSAPGPSSSNSASGGVPGATGPMPLPDGPTTQITPYANGGIPSRGGALRMRKPKPGNVAKPTKAAAAAMHPPMEKAPVDNQEMGAEGGPPRNTDAQPGSQDPMLANGGFLPARENPKPPKYQPAPNPNSFEKNEKNDSQLSRFSRVEKRFADGDEVKLPTRPGQQTSGPATGLEPAEPVEPETTGHHLAKTAVDFFGMTALSPNSPYQQVSGALQKGVGAVTDYLNSPWDAQPTGHAASPGTSAPVPAAPPPSPESINGQYGPLAPDQDPSIKIEHGRPDDGMQRTAPDGTPITPYNKAALVDAMKGNNGGGAIPDRGAPGAPAPGVPGQQGPPAPDNTPFDFSQVQLDHRDIPDTSVKDWENMKQGIIGGLLAHRKAGSVEEASLMADNQVSQFQHQNFMQYLQQGIALDAAGNKQGAMAALKTAYQYMPTGHGMHFGLDQQGNIVGVGYDEDNQKPVGTPVKLDQNNLNHLASTYADPKNFQAENIAMMEQKRKDRETNAQVPLLHAQTAETMDRGQYFLDANPEKLLAAQIRAQASGQNRLSLQSQRFYAQQLNGAIVDPAEQGQALTVAGSLERQYGNSPEAQAKIVGFLKQLYNHPPETREAFARQQGIDLTGGSLEPSPSMAPPRAGGWNPALGIPTQ